MEDQPQLPQVQINQKAAVLLHIANLAIKATSVALTFYMLKKVKVNINYSLHRTEFTPSPNGRLIAVEYYAERVQKIRYATMDEVWNYSHEEMMDQLSAWGYVNNSEGD